jgi:hypothetical protein
MGIYADPPAEMVYHGPCQSITQKLDMGKAVSGTKNRKTSFSLIGELVADQSDDWIAVYEKL